MAKIKASEAVSFKLASIRIEQFATFSIDHSKVNGRPNMNCQIRLILQAEVKQVGVVFQVDYDFESKPLLKLQVNVFFEVNDTGWAEMLGDGTFTMKKSFMRHLATVASGIVRGILHSKTEHTEHNRYMLPLLNLEEFIKEDVVMELL